MEEKTNVPEKPKRPRITINKGVPALEDPKEFKKNKCTEYAKFICNTSDNIETEIHIDKHYQTRHLIGSDNGDKRLGIEPEIVEALVKRAMKYLLAFGSMVKIFKFINYEGQSENPISVILQEGVDENTLNVAIQVHFIEINRYEITIKTAMCIEKFKVDYGQFAVIIEDGGATLNRCNNGKLDFVCEI